MKTYEELRKINVNEHIEKKNNLSYLSWAWAVDVLFQNDPDASWGYSMFDGKPWMDVNGTFMVFCTVKAFGRERTAQLPIMDYRNKPITAFTSFDLNTTMQRSLAKAISLHGLGLYIYAGEDLPGGEAPEKKEESAGQIVELTMGMENLTPEVAKGLREEAKKIEAEFYTQSAKSALARWNDFKETAGEDEVIACWQLLDSKTRSGIKRAGKMPMAEATEADDGNQ